MHDLIQLRVCVGTGSWLVPMSQNAYIDELFNVIARNYLIGINPSEMILLSEGIYLEYGNEKYFKDYSLDHLSTVVANLPLCGGIWPLRAIKDRKTNLQPLPGFITVTSSQPDMIDLEDSPDEKRARMPCGHVIGPNSMTSYCQSVLSKGEFKFYCPSVDDKGKGNCTSEWDFFLVRHVACLSPDETQEFEKKISNNFLQKSKGYQTCPGCNTWCYKGDGTGNYVRCPVCTKNFCWACMRDWVGPRNGQSCGNSDCDGSDTRTRNLQKCPTKEIEGCKACPTLRACPSCGMMTSHISKCAHVTCDSCKHGFCFICLKGRSGNGGWPCPPSGTCTLAPRQTSTSWSAPVAIAPVSQPESSSRCSIM